MNIVLARVTSNRRLQAAGVNVDGCVNASGPQRRASRSYPTFGLFHVPFPGVIVHQLFCLQRGPHAVFLFRPNEAVNWIAHEKDDGPPGPGHFLKARNYLLAPILSSQGHQNFLIHGVVLLCRPDVEQPTRQAARLRVPLTNVLNCRG
jgi:hypothetical protein